MSDINYSTLRSTCEDFVRIETLCAANDLVSNFINGLSIFKIWNLLDDKRLDVAALAELLEQHLKQSFWKS